MDDKMTTSRREAMGLASIAVAAAAAVTMGGTAAARSPATQSARPTTDELERAKRLYGGEFGGGRGAY